jgi:hypothetical protein
LFLFRRCKTLFRLIWACALEGEGDITAVGRSSVLYRLGDSRSREDSKWCIPPWVLALLSVAFGNGPRPKLSRLSVDLEDMVISVCDRSKPRYVMHRAQRRIGRACSLHRVRLLFAQMYPCTGQHRPTYGGQQALSEFQRLHAVLHQSCLTCDSAVSTSRELPDLASP